MNATEKDINLLDSDLLKTEIHFEDQNSAAVRLGLKFMRSTIEGIKRAKTPPLAIEGFTNDQLLNELRRRLES